MNITALKTAHDPVQQARAEHMRDLFEPWSYRKLEQRTGIGRTALNNKFTGNQPFTLNDIEALAPLVRMTPESLAIELFAIPDNKKAPTPKSEGLKLPELDSNQQPAGSQLGNVYTLPIAPTNHQIEHANPAPIIKLFG